MLRRIGEKTRVNSGNVTARASALVGPDAVIVAEASRPGDALPQGPQGSFLFVAGEVRRAFGPASEVFTDFGKMRFPTKCSHGVLIGNHSVSPRDSPCSGMMTALGSGISFLLTCTWTPSPFIRIRFEKARKL
jgi:hypothetical protein